LSVVELPDSESAVTGYLVPRTIVFMGRGLRWGGCGGLHMLRLFRREIGRCEQRWMDEHIVLARGVARRLRGELIDENLNNIGWWTSKHNGYAAREAIDILGIGYDGQRTKQSVRSALFSHAARKRVLKEMIYAKLPGGLRAVSYFLYRYIGLLGFLDGRAGFYFHALQGLWYRLLVDVKVMEIQRRANDDACDMSMAVKREYGIDVAKSSARLMK